MSNDGKKYELAYLLNPAIAQEKVLDVVAEIRNVLENASGNILNEEQPRMRQLAYKMAKTINNKKQHFGEAYLGFIRFSVPTSKTSEIEASLRKNESVIRSLLVKIDAAEKAAARRPLRPRTVRTDEPKQEISHEEIDRELQNLIGEENKVIVEG